MPISKGLIPNSMLCLIPKVLLQCPVSVHFMSNSKGLPTLIRFLAVFLPKLHVKARLGLGKNLERNCVVAKIIIIAQAKMHLKVVF